MVAGTEGDAAIRSPSEGELREELRGYYDPLLPYWDRTLEHRGDLPFWSELAREWAGERVLELGAGTGRVTRALAAEAGEVVALDLDLEALRMARDRLADGSPVRCVLADMRTFRLGKRFPRIAAADDPFSHLRSDADRDRALERVAEHLAPDGTFVLDALWFSEATLAEATSPEGRSARHVSGGGSGETLVEVRHTWRCDPDTRLCRAEYEVRAEGRSRSTTFRGRYWTREEADRRLEAAGLAVREAWGDYGRAAWTPEAEHLIVVARPL